MSKPVAKICDDLGIKIVQPAQHRPFTPLQTAAGNTLDKILRENGENHLRDVLTVLTESENNRNMLIAPVIKAVSRIMAQHPSWYASDASAFLEIMDKADLVEMYRDAKPDKRVVSTHDAIATKLLAKLSRKFKAEKERNLFNVEP